MTRYIHKDFQHCPFVRRSQTTGMLDYLLSTSMCERAAPAVNATVVLVELLPAQPARLSEVSGPLQAGRLRGKKFLGGRSGKPSPEVRA